MLPLLEQAMNVAAARANALTHNMANANTPGYLRQEVPFFSLMRQFVASGEAPARAESDIASPANGDGNTVNLEKELAAISENAVLYQAIVRFASGRLAQLKFAISEGRR